jgi:hypothetical protein
LGSASNAGGSKKSVNTARISEKAAFLRDIVSPFMDGTILTEAVGRITPPHGVMISSLRKECYREGGAYPKGWDNCDMEEALYHVVYILRDTIFI